ncbi:hypothetical protein [Microvirga pudoricolor]|uniref:hypothetical protein n=1 Tax=Microvirga pudoricolor TaxID=2778729 RepID=UPI0019519BDD|nr:hypothetical protein [Microvirga pudoricolor]MBM6592623.1 hypothetical protein [Microvirga pudoricolor]
MAERTITAYFDTYDDAAKAVRRLEATGISHSRISVVANNTDNAYSQHAYRTFDETSVMNPDPVPGDRASDRISDRTIDRDGDGAGTGATIGTLAGGGAGLLAGLGMLALPGLGPIVAAGWLVSTLVGAGAGAAVGGLAGSLVHAGVDERDAHAYAEGIRRGGALVTVRTEEAEADRVTAILDAEGRVDMEDRQANWRSDGWGGPPIGAAGSTTTGLTTGLTPTSFSTGDETRTNVEIEDERSIDRATGTDRDRI